MNFVWFLALLLPVGLSRGYPQCFFDRYSKTFEPIFLQKLGTQVAVLPVKGFGINITDSSDVEIYCPNGFKLEHLKGDLREEFGKDTKSAYVTCTQNTIKVKVNELYHIMEEEVVLSCKKPSISLYEAHHLMCQDATAFALGTLYQNQPLVLAEICYDLNAMKLKYIHYQRAARSPLIKHQEIFAPIRNYFSYYHPIDVASGILALSTKTVQKKLQEAAKTHSTILNYEYGSLIPPDAFSPFLGKSVEDGNFMTNILWWNGLKYGNWRTFQNVLETESKYTPFIVIQGTSGVLQVPSTLPDCNQMKEVSIEVNSLTQSAPLLVWTYVKAINGTQRDEFVIFGVNTPFFEFYPKDKSIICQDVCNRIPWLNKYQNFFKFRYISALGYMYCCNPYEVRIIMKDFPELGYRGTYREAEQPTNNSGESDNNNYNGNNKKSYDEANGDDNSNENSNRSNDPWDL